jgi:hypothetical protein
MSTRPPRRWVDSELPDSLTRVLSSAEADASDAAFERVQARLSRALGPAFEGAEHSPSANPAPSSARASALMSHGKWLGVGAILAAGLGALWSARPVVPPEAPRPQPVAFASEPAQAETSAPMPTAPLLTEPAAAEPPAPSTPAPEPATADEPANLRARGARERDLRKRESTRPGSPGAVARVSSQPEPAAEQRADPGLAQELRQLAEIRVQLRASPERALAAADVHEQRFAHAALGPERELLRIDALLRLGQVREARQRAERMLAAPDAHPYRAQIEKLLAGTPPATRR